MYDAGFFSQLYNGTKSQQDTMLLMHMEFGSGTPKRHRVRNNSGRQRPIPATYYIRQVSTGLRVRVCAATFRSVTCTSRFRLNRLIRQARLGGGTPKENRGGARIHANDQEITESIKNHISSFKCRQSHYGRNKSTCSYLPPDLTISKMFNMWKATRHQIKKKVCSYQKYRQVFCRSFNLGFGNPRQDTCSFCASKKIELRNAAGVKKQKVITELRLHKLRAKKFFELLRKKDQDTVTISFDMQQNQPLPKLTTGEVFYSRQVWLYNLTFVKEADDNTQTARDVKIYTWLETESGRGSNEVGSALHHYLISLEGTLHGKRDMTLRLFSDSCSSQNKNAMIMCLLARFVQTSKVFVKIMHTFPVRGHSYMPPDRVFGRIEKQLRKTETIVSPTEYYNVFSQHGQVMRWNVEWKSRDYQAVQKKICKTSKNFKMQEQKIFTYMKSRPNEVGTQVVYTQEPVFSSFLKKGRKFSELDSAVLLKKSNKVKVAKKKDIEKLMNHFTVPDDAKDFYADVLAAAVVGSKDDDIEVDTYDENETFL